jgi:maleylpyruvate isomerase
MMHLTLHAYWRSSASFRVRIALALKGLDYAYVGHDLRTGAQRDPAYLALNPLGLVPALEVESGGQRHVLTQSVAILEWLDDMVPSPALYPADPFLRAEARALVAMIAADVQPLQNPRVLKRLREEHGANMPASDDWARHWIGLGLDAVEVVLARHTGSYAIGNALSAVDCALVPQCTNAERFGMDLARWPRIQAVVTAARAHPAVIAASPENQPDADQV